MANPHVTTMNKAANRGKWNSATIKAFQYWARKKGYYPAGYLIDGKEGVWTRKALQNWCRATGTYTRAIDGDIGTHSVDALRRTLDKVVNFGFTVYDQNGKVIAKVDGKLRKVSYFPTTEYVAKLQTYVAKQN